MLDSIVRLVHPTPVANTEALAAFAEEMMISANEESAHQRFPVFAAHLDRCQECREELAGFVNLLGQAQALGFFEATPIATAQSSAPAQEQAVTDPLWLPSGQGILRLREELTILVGKLTVAVVSAIPGIRTFESPVEPALLSANWRLVVKNA